MDQAAQKRNNVLEFPPRCNREEATPRRRHYRDVLEIPTIATTRRFSQTQGFLDGRSSRCTFLLHSHACRGRSSSVCHTKKHIPTSCCSLTHFQIKEHPFFLSNSSGFSGKLHVMFFFSLLVEIGFLPKRRIMERGLCKRGF